MARNLSREAEVQSPLLTDGHGQLGHESTRRYLLLGLEVLFVLVIAVSLGTLFTRANQRFDLTPEKKYSLSGVTRQILHSLTQPVQTTVFYRRGDREKHGELLGLMEEESSFFTYQLFDLDRTPGLAQRYGVTAYGATVIETEGNRLTLPMADEERLLNALLRVTQSEKAIYFVVGHGENDPVDAEERTGYGVLRRVLETENYRIRPLPLLQARAVPRDADLVIVSGPKEDLIPGELEALSAYFAAGGNALFMLDPYTVPELSRYLAQFGFLLGEDVLVLDRNDIIQADYVSRAPGSSIKKKIDLVHPDGGVACEALERSAIKARSISDHEQRLTLVSVLQLRDIPPCARRSVECTVNDVTRRLGDGECYLAGGA